MFTTGNTSASQSFDLNVTDVKLGFFSGNNVTSQENFKYWDILVSNRGCNTSGGAKITVNVNVKNCTLDLVTNAHPKASIGTFKENSDTDHCYTDYNVTFDGCEFILTSPAALYGVTSKSGDKITFIKGEDGTYGKVLLPAGNYTQTFDGIDDGYPSKAILRTRGEVSGSDTIYYLTTGSDILTAYGTIPASYTNALSNPYAIFKRIDGAYAFDSTKTTLKTAVERAIALTKLNGGITDDAVVLLREDVKDNSWPDNVSDIAGTLTIDLAGHTLSSGVTLLRTDFDDDSVVNGVQKKTVVNVKNGSLGFSQFGALFTTTNNSSYTVPKALDLNFENVNFAFYNVVKTDGDNYKYRDLLASDRGNTSGTAAYISIKAVNCTFDLMTGSKSIAVLATLDGNADKGNNHYSVEIIGGSIVTDSFDKIDCSMSASGDSFKFGKDSNGTYPEILVKAGTNDPADSVSRIGDNGINLTFVDSGRTVNSLYKRYDLSESILTSYGQVPATANTFALFSKDASGRYIFKAGYDTYAKAMNAAIGLTSATLATPSSEAVIVMIRDWSGYTYPSGLSSIATTVTVDLNGHTLGAYESLGNTATGDVKDPSGEIVKTNGTINYVNGTLILDYHPGIYIAATGSYTKGYGKTLNVNFDNVYFGTSDTAKTAALIGRVASNHTTEIATFNFKLTGCTFDMATNRSSAAAFCIGNWMTGSDHTKVDLDFIDCDFIGLTEADFKHVMTEGQDTVSYYKTDGNHYATLTLPKSAQYPTGTYVANGKTAAFVKIAETEAEVTYALLPEQIIALGYAPMMSITLSNDFIMNVYVPVSYTEEFTLDGKVYNKDNSYGGRTVTRDGKDYYHVTVALGSSEAARDVMLSARVVSGEVSATASYTFSILRYAEKIIKYTDSSDVEKTLMKDVLAYVKEAYMYFTSHNGETDIYRVCEAVEAIIGDYSSTPTSSGTAVGDVDGIVKEVTLNLSAKPTIRFYVTDTDIIFSSANKALPVTVAEDGSYIELDVYAYALCETVTFGNGGSYHISEFAKGCVGEAHEALVNSFICYVESAAAYRNYIIAQQ